MCIPALRPNTFFAVVLFLNFDVYNTTRIRVSGLPEESNLFI